MIIKCTDCSTRYVVDPAVLGPTGRRVRCAKCGYTWHESPLEQSTPAAPTEPTAPAGPAEPAAPEAPAAEAEAPTPAAVEEPASPEVDMPDLAAARRRRRRRNMPKGTNLPAVSSRKSRANLMGWMILISVVALISVGTVSFRDSIVEAWPPSKKLYDTLGLEIGQPSEQDVEIEQPVNDISQLSFQNINLNKDTDQVSTFIMVRGEIVNGGGQRISVPQIRGTGLDQQQQLVHEWFFDPPRPDIGPGQIMTFESRVDNPPDTMFGVVVYFVEDR